jgi:hypothetical protein
MMNLPINIVVATTCHTVYSPSLEWWFPAVGLPFLVVAAFFAVSVKGWKRLFVLAIGAFTFLWTLRAGVRVLGDYLAARRAAESPSTRVVEGPVENYRPTAPDSSGDESFTVRGVYFTYSYYMITGAFRQTADHGGPVRPGRSLRIHFRPDSDAYIVHPIVKMEVCP